MKEKTKHKEKLKLDIIKIIDISDTFGKLKRKVSGQEFKDKAKTGWIISN